MHGEQLCFFTKANIILEENCFFTFSKIISFNALGSNHIECSPHLSKPTVALNDYYLAICNKRGDAKRIRL